VANGVCPFGRIIRVADAVGVKRVAEAVGVKRVAEAVGVRRVAIDVGVRRRAVLTATGEGGTAPLLHVTEVTNAFCKNPCGMFKSAGAVRFDGACRQSFMFDGVRPDGTSMKVFLTGSGIPLFVAPSSTAPGT